MVTEMLKSLGQFFGSSAGLRRRNERDAKLPERRSAARYPTVENGGWLGWREDETFCEVPAQVDDISQDGAKVTVERLPPPAEPLWLRLESPGRTGWCPVMIVHRVETDAGTHALGLQFPDSCSYELFVGLRGLTAITKLEYGPTEFDSHRWR